MLPRLLRHIEAGYPDNPYHSATHAADVLQTLHVLIHGAQLHVHYLDPLALLAAYWAAVREPIALHDSVELVQLLSLLGPLGGS